MNTTQQEACSRASLLHYEPIIKVNEFVDLQHPSKPDDSPLRYSTRGFLDKRAKSGERKLPGSTEKLERGLGLSLDTTGSRKCDVDADFLPKSSQSKHENTGEHDQDKSRR